MMKLSIEHIASLFLSAVLFISCNTEPLGPDVPDMQEGRITSVVHYRASVGEGPDTRASLNDVNQYIFESGDSLFVVVVDKAGGGTNMYGILNLVAGAGDIKGTFEGDLMCLNGFEPTDATVLSVTLVSREDKIHTHADGRITNTSYDVGDDEYATNFKDAIRFFSDFKAENSFGAHSFSLEQNSTFLIFSITFDDTEAGTISASGSNVVTAAFYNNGSPLPLRTGPVTVSEIDYSVQANFVAAFPTDPSLSLVDATLTFTAAGDAHVSTYDDIANATLQPNRYYEVTKSHVTLDYFTVQAREAGAAVTFNYTGGAAVEYNLNGSGWLSYTAPITLVNERDYVQFRTKRTTFNTDGTPIITVDKPCFIYGKIMSLICDSSWNPKSSLDSKAFQYAFKGADNIDIPAGRPLKLSATSLGTYCYNQMFDGCTSITRPPELQTKLAGNVPNYACAYMFRNCTALIAAPDLPSDNTTISGDNDITVQQYGYQGMFQGCTSLTTVPATIVGTSGKQACENMFNGCSSLANAPIPTSSSVGNSGYNQMFMNCTSLVQAPELRATTLGTSAYKSMFNGCTSLVSTPEELPATSLADNCYQNMFSGCIALSQAMEELPATIGAPSCYYSMFYGCISLNHGPTIMIQDVKANGCRSMFQGCTSLVTLSLEDINAVGADGCRDMFRGCGELTYTPTALNAASLSSNAYYSMYRECVKITQAPDILATTLGTQCCYQMFYGCKRLRFPPSELPAPIVISQAYKQMFYGCVSLASAPDMSAMTEVQNEGCYQMFFNCSNLTSAPELPATTLSTSAYYEMFKNAGLRSAPLLPATTLASGCYKGMMQGCKYLEGPVLLPAPTLVTDCYRDMFNGASALNSVVVLATSGIGANNSTTTWLASVSASGTFVRPSGVTSWTSNSSSGIPTGWEVKDTGMDPLFDDDGAFDQEEEL